MSRRFLLGAAIIAVSPIAIAVTTTDPIIVTATRTAQTVDETLAPVTVITREDIETRQIRSMPDLLANQPGITVSNNGGRGKSTSVFMRGTESDHVLVLIDGIKVGSATLGTTPFQDLPIDEVERVEIVRGPRAQLYGSEAIGGVIQIFTRRGGGELTPSVSFGGGSYGTVEGSLGLSGGGNDAWFNIHLSGEDTDGFNACNGEPGVGGCFANEPDDDGYSNTAGSVRAGYHFGNGTELDFHWLQSDSESEFDGAFQNEGESTQEVLGSSLRLMPTDNSLVTVNLGVSEDRTENFKDGVFASRFDTDRDSASLQGDYFGASDSIFSLGLDYIDDNVSGSTDFEVTSRDNTGVFAQYQASIARTDVLLGLRHDDNEQFGGNTTGGITLGRATDNGVRYTFSYATAFKAPSFNELYFPGFGNPDLGPEESDSIEFGITGVGGRWSVNLFQTDINDLISFDAAASKPVNVDEARIRGVELVTNISLHEWNIIAALTLLDPESRAAATRGNQLPRRAKESLRIDADRDYGRYSAGATVHAEGRKYDNLGNTLEIDSYITLDLRAAMDIASGWSAELSVVNVFDEDYETAAFYNQPGRSAYLMFRYRPER
ncbi:MAG: TonB-dependent receptor [marine bacterium B5-7]|nr:MAG: TonB-dependent receptor [marine bacterium B5-7]